MEYRQRDGPLPVLRPVRSAGVSPHLEGLYLVADGRRPSATQLPCLPNPLVSECSLPEGLSPTKVGGVSSW